MIQRKHVSVPSTPNRQHDRKSSKSLQKYKAKHSVQPKLRKKILKYATYAAIKNETASYWLPCSKLCCLLKHRCWVSSYMNTQILQVFCLLKKTQMLKPPYAVFFAYLSLCLSAIGLHCSTEKRRYWLPHPPPKKKYGCLLNAENRAIWTRILQRNLPTGHTDDQFIMHAVFLPLIFLCVAYKKYSSKHCCLHPETLGCISKSWCKPWKKLVQKNACEAAKISALKLRPPLCWFLASWDISRETNDEKCQLTSKCQAIRPIAV